jgi:solute carrier family 35 protein F1/2
MSNDHDLDKQDQDLKDGGSLEAGQGEESATTPSKATRPPIVYSSPGAFAKSFAARWRSIWTRQFILALVAGQVVSLCITCTNVTTTELVMRGWTLSTTQGFFLWVIFLLV